MNSYVIRNMLQYTCRIQVYGECNNDKGKNTKKENRIVVLTIALLGLFIVIGTSFALWNLTFRQTSTNQITTSCFKIDFIEKDDINLQEAYPLTDEEGKNLSPYTFTITNICDTSATYQVNLEELEVEGKKLSNQYINLSLNEKVGKLSTFEEVNKTLDNATISHKLTTGVLKSKEEKSFQLRLWLRDDSPSNEEIMNAIFLSKITVITVYKKNIPEVSSLAYENQDTIKVDVNTISNPDNETLNYYYQLDDNEEIKSNTGTHTFPNLQDGIYKIKVRVEDTNGILIYEKEENVVVAYVHVYISSTGNDTTGDGSPDSPYATLQRAYNKVKSGGEMILLSDITATSTTNMNTANKEVTLKSNGENTYSILRKNMFKNQILDITNSNKITITNITFDGNNLEATSSIIEVRSSTLNLREKSTIKNAIHIGKYYAEFNMNGTMGSAIYAYQSTLNINGADISYNQTKSSYVSGGTIFLSHGVLNLESGDIHDNSSAQYAGGITIQSSTMNMSGGTIRNNTAERGGGIYLASDFENVKMIMTGGSIKNNQASYGGGIMANQGENYNISIFLKKGTILNNIAPNGTDIFTSDGVQIIDER